MSREFYSHTAPSEAGASPGTTPYGTPGSSTRTRQHNQVERHHNSTAAGAQGQQLVRASDYKPPLSLLKQEILTVSSAREGDEFRLSYDPHMTAEHDLTARSTPHRKKNTLNSCQKSSNVISSLRCALWTLSMRSSKLTRVKIQLESRNQCES